MSKRTREASKSFTRTSSSTSSGSNNQNRYKKIVEALGAMVWCSDYDSFTFSFVSPEARRIFGYPLSYWTEKEDFWQQILHPDDRERVMKECTEAIQNNRPYELEYRIIDSQGKSHHVKDIVRLIKEGTEPKEKVGIIIDMTDKKESMQELEKVKDQLLSVFKLSPVPVSVSTFDEEGKIIDVNQAFLEATGYTDQNLQGKQLSELKIWIHPEDKQRISETLFREKSIKKMPMFIRNLKGEVRDILISVELVPINDCSLMVAVYYDVSDKNRYEAELQDKNNEMEVLMFKASHNLKGPVASLKGILHIANKEIKDENALMYLNLINKSTQTLETTLEELLDMSSVRNKDLQLNKVNMDEVMNEVCEKFRFLPEWKEIKFTKKVSLDEKFVSDKNIVTSILQNLIENSIKYRDPIKDRTKISVAIQEKNGVMKIRVKDNGMGIPDDLQEKVFEMFVRASDQSKGSGLGLYIVKKAVEKLGGRIVLKSKQREGTTFTILIPNQQATINNRNNS